MLVGLVGRRGSGKTVLQIALGYALSSMYNVDIYSNFELKESKMIKTFAELKDIKNSIVILDEVWRSWDSRFWKNNVFAMRWLQMLRHNRLIVIYTTQLIGQVDIRMRRTTEILGICRKIAPNLHEITFGEYYDGLGLFKSRRYTMNVSKMYGSYDSWGVIHDLN